MLVSLRKRKMKFSQQTPQELKVLKTAQLDTPLGPMIAIASNEALYLLEFVDRQDLEREIESFKARIKSTLTPGYTNSIYSIEKELRQYFEGNLQEFKTPLFLLGTPFQKSAWDQLRKIPYGKTVSYADQASAIGKPKAYRAVAQANGCNRFPVVIPCHRVINTSGELGGYSSGLARKKWLLNHEKKKLQPQRTLST